jgi:hypothetical protein
VGDPSLDPRYTLHSTSSGCIHRVADIKEHVN